jgi:hypothetical protein
MREIGKEKKRRTEQPVETGGPPEASDIAIPVCLGEFDLNQARSIRRLWELTWSQDARAGKKDKK